MMQNAPISCRECNLDLADNSIALLSDIKHAMLLDPPTSVRHCFNLIVHSMAKHNLGLLRKCVSMILEYGMFHYTERTAYSA